jgi:hypothetical protein
MIKLTLQRDEADAVERILDLIITNKDASDAIFSDGAERRSARRASKKIHWASKYTSKTCPNGAT